jgi:deoxyadenosine/deoxycytidine kinase
VNDEAPKRSNGKIDKALNALMKKLPEMPPDVAVKVIATAISWEKVKHRISEDAGEFNPDNL